MDSLEKFKDNNVYKIKIKVQCISILQKKKKCYNQSPLTRYNREYDGCDQRNPRDPIHVTKLDTRTEWNEK